MPDFPELYEPLLYAAAGLVGIISCFFGYKLFKGLVVALMALSGAAGLAYAGFSYGQEPILWSIGGLIIGGILGGTLALSFYSLAVATVAALFVATSLLPWVQGYDILVQWAVIGVASLIAALVATGLTNLMIQLASGMLGALLLVHSGMYFAYGQTVHRAVEEGDDWVLYLDMDLQTALISLAIGLIGFLIQRRGAKK